jgi:hypothetical protein
MLLSVLDLGGAAARFAAEQIQTGFHILTDPGSTLEVMQNSIQSCAKAMNNSVDKAGKS